MKEILRKINVASSFDDNDGYTLEGDDSEYTLEGKYRLTFHLGVCPLDKQCRALPNLVLRISTVFYVKYDKTYRRKFLSYQGLKGTNFQAMFW